MKHDPKQIRYVGDRGIEFHRDLNRKIEHYLKKSGQTRFANAEMWAKCFFFLSAYFATWALLSFGELSAKQGILLALLLGFLGTGIALNIGHDASHANFSKRPWVNHLLFWVSMNMLGIYSYLWKIGHIQSHHRLSNVPHYDAGFEVNNIIRFTELTPWRPWHRFQVFYAPLLYMTYTALLVLVRDWVLFFRKEVWSIRMRHSKWRLAELASIKLLYFTGMLGIPIFFSSFSWREVLVGYVLMHAVISLYVSAALFSTHISDLVELHSPNAAGEITHSFIEHQFRTISDFHPTSPAANFLVGGFNAHLLHHLYPRLNSIHSPALSQLLIGVSQEYGLHYRRTDILSLIRAHYRYLSKMSQPPAHPSRAITTENGPAPRPRVSARKRGVRRSGG